MRCVLCVSHTHLITQLESYEGCTDTDEDIVWFWDNVSELSVDDRKRLLQWWGSMPCSPAGGFATMSESRILCGHMWWPAYESNMIPFSRKGSNKP